MFGIGAATSHRRLVFFISLIVLLVPSTVANDVRERNAGKIPEAVGAEDASFWMCEQLLLQADINRDGSLESDEFAHFVQMWQQQNNQSLDQHAAQNLSFQEIQFSLVTIFYVQACMQCRTRLKQQQQQAVVQDVKCCQGREKARLDLSSVLFIKQDESSGGVAGHQLSPSSSCPRTLVFDKTIQQVCRLVHRELGPLPSKTTRAATAVEQTTNGYVPVDESPLSLTAADARPLMREGERVFITEGSQELLLLKQQEVEYCVPDPPFSSSHAFDTTMFLIPS